MKVVGYQDSDVDTLLVSKYQSGSNYSDLIGTDTLSAAELATGNDTDSSEVLRIKTDLDPDFDWKVIIPATGQAITLQDIVYDERNHKACKIELVDTYHDFYSPILSIVVNNTPVSFDTYYPIIEIHK